jgi:hypothetical protein
LIISQLENGATFTANTLIAPNKVAIYYCLGTISQKVVIADITDPKNPIY